MFNDGVGQTLRQCLYDALSEWIVFSVVLLVSDGEIHVLTLYPLDETCILNTLSVRWRLESEGMMNVKQLHVFFVFHFVVQSFKTE